MCTHKLCLRAKIRNNVYPCTPQFYYTKVGCKGVFVTRTCFRDVFKNLTTDVLYNGICLSTPKLPLIIYLKFVFSEEHPTNQ